MKFLTLGFILLSITAFGAKVPKNLKTLLKFDFECSEEQLNVKNLGKGHFGVEGCGKKASYTCDYTKRATPTAEVVPVFKR